LTPSSKKTISTRSAKEYFLIPKQEEHGRGVSEIISMREIAQILNERNDAAPIRQRIVIIDACFGGYFVNVSPLTVSMFENELPADGFFALTSLKGVAYDGQYGPIILNGLKGGADDSVSGNHNSVVSLYELTNYIDYHVGEIGKRLGEKFSSRYIFVGSGEVVLTLTNKGKSLK
jgi:hypothetical protein